MNFKIFFAIFLVSFMISSDCLPLPGQIIKYKVPNKYFGEQPSETETETKTPNVSLLDLLTQVHRKGIPHPDVSKVQTGEIQVEDSNVPVDSEGFSSIFDPHVKTLLKDGGDVKATPSQQALAQINQLLSNQITVPAIPTDPQHVQVHVLKDEEKTPFNHLVDKLVGQLSNSEDIIKKAQMNVFESTRPQVNKNTLDDTETTAVVDDKRSEIDDIALNQVKFLKEEESESEATEKSVESTEIAVTEGSTTEVSETEASETEENSTEKVEDQTETIFIPYDAFPQLFQTLAKEVEKILQGVLKDENNDEELISDATRHQENPDDFKGEVSPDMLKTKNEIPEDSETEEETTEAKMEEQTEKNNEEVMENQDNFIRIVIKIGPVKETTIINTEENDDQVSSTVSSQEEPQTTEAKEENFTEKSQEVAERFEPEPEKSEPETGKSEPETGKSEPETGKSEPEIGKSEPEATKSDPQAQEIIVVEMNNEPSSDEASLMLQNVRNIVGTVEQQSILNLDKIRNIFKSTFSGVKSEIKDSILNVKDRILSSHFTSDLEV